MAAIGTTVDRRAKWDAFLTQVRSADGTYVKVGVTSDVGSMQKKIDLYWLQRVSEHKKPKGESPTLAQVALWNEFGTEHADGSVMAPERSFIRSTHDESRAALVPLKRRLLRKVFVDHLPMRQALGLLGEWMQKRIQRKIRETDSPPNAKSTSDAKGSSHPLIDTGQLLQSIRYEVHAGASETIDSHANAGAP